MWGAHRVNCLLVCVGHRERKAWRLCPTAVSTEGVLKLQGRSVPCLLQHFAFHGMALNLSPLVMNILHLEQAQLARIATRKLAFDLHLAYFSAGCFSVNTFEIRRSHSLIHVFKYFVGFAAIVLLPLLQVLAPEPSL